MAIMRVYPCLEYNIPPARAEKAPKWGYFQHFEGFLGIKRSIEA